MMKVLHALTFAKLTRSKAVFVAVLFTIITMQQTAMALSPQFAVSNPGSGGGGATTCTLPDGHSGEVQADGHTCCPVGTKDDTSCLFTKYINPAIALISAAVGIAIAIAIIVGGIEYITSAGDPQRAAEGKKRIANALIGLVAFALLFAFLQFIIPGGVLNG